MKRRTALTAATCGLTSAALMLTACGSSKNDAKIKSTPTTTAAAAPTTTPAATMAPTSAAADPKAPVFDFPKDVKVTVDPNTTGDATKDAILRDQAYSVQSIYLAIAKLDPSLPVFNKYLAETAKENWSKKITWGKAHDRSVTGTVQFYDRKVTISSPTTAGVTFCENQRRSFDKNPKTGKVFTTQPSAQDFILHSSFMRKAHDGTWQTATYNSQDGAAQCQR